VVALLDGLFGNDCCKEKCGKAKNCCKDNGCKPACAAAAPACCGVAAPTCGGGNAPTAAPAPAPNKVSEDLAPLPIAPNPRPDPSA
jgi:hypothetical protein